ncbi:hypothetical protein TCSYLVIO_006566 [Trypanosoma cruzi]|nr:hypothetical protein TCSYLVIO_006566 [Trypanosoma cruzi]
MRRQMYTREELIALREALALDTFADPVPLDCPMRTDSDLTLHQTTVRKRNKEDWKVMSFSKRISAFNGTIGENNVTTRPDIHRANFGEASITLCRSNRTEEYTDCDDCGCKVIMPPRLQIPFVTIDPMRRHYNTSSREYKKKAEVNIDMERNMVARLRLRQQRQPTKKISLNVEKSSHGTKRSLIAVWFLPRHRRQKQKMHRTVPLYILRKW